jgi:hypothetical protein
MCSKVEPPERRWKRGLRKRRARGHGCAEGASMGFNTMFTREWARYYREDVALVSAIAEAWGALCLICEHCESQQGSDGVVFRSRTARQTCLTPRGCE